MVIKIEFESQENFKNIIKDNSHHLEKLIEIVKDSGEEFEGNCFYYHKSFNEINDINKKINLLIPKIFQKQNNSISIKNS